MAAVTKAVHARYPDVAVVPSMSAGATDSYHFRAAGVSSYGRSEEHTSELQPLMRISYAVFCLKKKKQKHTSITTQLTTQNNQHNPKKVTCVKRTISDTKSIVTTATHNLKR